MPLTSRTVAYLWCLAVLGASGEMRLIGAEKLCDVSAVRFTQCGPSETCMSVDTISICRCRKDFERKTEDGPCQLVPNQNPSPSPNTSSTEESGGFGFKLLLWLVLPVLLAAAIGVVVYTGRQKVWLSRIYRMRVRSYNNVLVSSQDEDDPPIA